MLKRVNVVLGAFYDPDHAPDIAAGVRQEFLRALAQFPTWAIQQAFDEWMASMNRRPTPGDIVILVGKVMRPITDELARRQRLAAQEALVAPEPDRCSAEAAQSILARAGFTPKRLDAVRGAPMANTFADAEAHQDEPPASHWSEKVGYDSPEMDALRKAREANPIMRQALAGARKGDAA